MNVLNNTKHVKWDNSSVLEHVIANVFTRYIARHQKHLMMIYANVHALKMTKRVAVIKCIIPILANVHVLNISHVQRDRYWTWIHASVPVQKEYATILKFKTRKHVNVSAPRYFNVAMVRSLIRKAAVVCVLTERNVVIHFFLIL